MTITTSTTTATTTGTMTTETTTTTTTTSGMAGRTNYAEWDKKTASLLEDHSQEEVEETLAAKQALGLDGKYAHSESEAQERIKAIQVKEAKKVLDGYKNREGQVMQTLPGLLNEATTVRVTRDHLEAGKRVVILCDTTGSSPSDLIVLTQDLSHLESAMSNTQHHLIPKSYPGDVENGVPETPTTTKRTIYGLIKVFLTNIHNCTVIIRCKLISGTIELSHCSNITLKIDSEATVATVQADLCQSINIQFHDAPSGKNLPGHSQKLYWGDDPDDRIFSAGVSNMSVQLYRDGMCDISTTTDYLSDGAVAVGNATPEECQFVTSVIDGELITEKVIRHGATTGTNARAMTQRELEREAKRRDQISNQMAMDSTIKFIQKYPIPKRVEPIVVESIEEVYTMEKHEMELIIRECEQNKTRGNEAFGAGEYAQAVLLYSLALDKATELPDTNNTLFPRHVVLANRSAAFLKLGNHEKALVDGIKAQELDPLYIKGVFRRGLALHAMGKYQEAILVLAEAHKMEPKNKQIKQALQFAEVRLTQEMRKRTES